MEVSQPARVNLAWFAGLGVMTALEVIEWPVALVVAASHVVANQSHKRALRELAEGTEAGA